MSRELPGVVDLAASNHETHPDNVLSATLVCRVGSRGGPVRLAAGGYWVEDTHSAYDNTYRNVPGWRRRVAAAMRRGETVTIAA